MVDNSTPMRSTWATTIPVSNVPQQIKNEVGPIDILINNAGITRDASFKKLDKVNLGRGDPDRSRFGVQHDEAAVRQHGRAWLGPHHQCVVDHRLQGGFGQTNYAAAKAGMHGLHEIAGARWRRKA